MLLVDQLGGATVDTGYISSSRGIGLNLLDDALGLEHLSDGTNLVGLARCQPSVVVHQPRPHRLLVVHEHHVYGEATFLPQKGKLLLDQVIPF